MDGIRIRDGVGHEKKEEQRKAVYQKCYEILVIRQRAEISTMQGEAEGYQQRWHVSEVLGQINVVQSGMKIVWQRVEESDTFIWQPPWSLWGSIFD